MPLFWKIQTHVSHIFTKKPITTKDVAAAYLDANWFKVII